MQLVILFFQSANGKIELKYKNSFLRERLPSTVCSTCVDNDLNGRTFEITVTYVEDFTNNNVSASAKFTAQKNSAYVNFAPFSPRNYKAGLNYTGYVSTIFLF